MPPHWLEVLATIWIALAVASAGVICVDLTGRPQAMPIMDAVWPITALYSGPFALWTYLSFGRAGRETHRTMAQSTFISATHCGAGCAVGDMIGEWLVFLTGFRLLGSTLWADYLADFVLAYLFGVLFQFFSIAPMRHLGVHAGIIAAIKADTISIVAFEIGMFAWMALIHLLLFPHLTPEIATYWFMMQIAMMVGFATTYPANWLLVRAGVKEAM